MTQEGILQTQEETQLDELVRYSEGWQWREMILRGLVGIAAVAIAITVVLLFTKTARAPSDGTSSDCANVVSMVETLSPDCTRK